MQSKISVDMVSDLASKVGMAIQRFGPSWGWFTVGQDKTKKLFAKTNGEAYAALEELMAKLTSNTKELQLWHCTEAAGLLMNGKGLLPSQLPALAVCATSRAAVVRMLDAHFQCGPGTGRSSMAYRVRKYWKKGWPTPMLAVKHEIGMWETNSQNKVA